MRIIRVKRFSAFKEETGKITECSNECERCHSLLPVEYIVSVDLM